MYSGRVHLFTRRLRPDWQGHQDTPSLCHLYLLLCHQDTPCPMLAGKHHFLMENFFPDDLHKTVHFRAPYFYRWGKWDPKKLFPWSHTDSCWLRLRNPLALSCTLCLLPFKYSMWSFHYWNSACSLWKYLESTTIGKLKKYITKIFYPKTVIYILIWFFFFSVFLYG